MVTLGDSSVSVCASANLQCVVWTRTNKGGQLCSWGIYFLTYIHRWEGLKYSAHYVVEIRGRPLLRVTVQNVPCLLFGTLVPPPCCIFKKKKHLQRQRWIRGGGVTGEDWPNRCTWPIGQLPSSSCDCPPVVCVCLCVLKESNARC